jgi:SH3-like domain-containing protein
MSFHSIPATLRSTSSLHSTSYQWLTRLLLPFVVGTIVLTSSGCSMVMGFLGPTEAEITGTQNAAARLLVPTPVGNATASTALVNEPTPFVMRPQTTVEEPVSTLPAGSATASTAQQTSASRIMRVVLTGDAVNVRNAPGLDTQVLATMPRGTEFEYISKTDAGDWVQVCCVDNQLAWVYADLAQVTEGNFTPQAGAAVQTSPAQSTGTLGLVQTTTQSAPSAAAGTARIGLNRANDATRYRSTEDGFALTLPPSWLPLAESRGIVQASITTIEQDNPAMAALLADQLAAMSDIPVSLIAFDLAPETLSTGFATNLNVIKQPIPAGFALEYVVQFSADQLEEVLGLSDAATSTNVLLPAGEAIMLDYTLDEQAIARQYYLLHDQAVYILTFTSATSLANSSTVLFNEMMQSFTFE